MRRDVAIVGAGYVGMPLAQVFADAGKRVVLVDVDDKVVDGINRGESHIGDVSSDQLGKLVRDGLVSASSAYDEIKDADAILAGVGEEQKGTGAKITGRYLGLHDVATGTVSLLDSTSAMRQSSAT